MTTRSITITEDPAAGTTTIKIELCGAPRKTLPPTVIDVPGYEVTSDDAVVIRPAQFARAS